MYQRNTMCTSLLEFQTEWNCDLWKWEQLSCLQQMKGELKLWIKARCSFLNTYKWLHPCSVKTVEAHTGVVYKDVYAPVAQSTISLVSFESLLHYNKMGGKFCSYDRHNTCGVLVIRGVFHVRISQLWHTEFTCCTTVECNIWCCMIQTSKKLLLVAESIMECAKHTMWRWWILRCGLVEIHQCSVGTVAT